MVKAGAGDRSQRSSDMARLVTWHNGEKGWRPFSDEEMRRRQNAVRAYLSENAIDACLFTSYHNICYLSGFLYCSFGRKYGLVIDHDRATVIVAAIDGGQPWRRAFADTVTYTDWRKDNYLFAVQQQTKGVRRLGIEFDHVKSRHQASARGRAARGRVRRYRPADDADAHHQV